MNIRQIRELARIAQEHGLTALEVSEGETTVRIERGQAVAGAAPAVETVQPVAPVLPLPDEPKGSAVDFNHTYEVESPLVGVFYAAGAPGAEPFVKVGSHVKKGDVLCIIEAMKLMNEITSDRGGEVVDVCVGNGDVVEFGQTLFKLC